VSRRRRPASEARGHSTLYDFRDFDLMLKLEAEADDEGWVETEYLAVAMGLRMNGDRTLRDTGIGQRLAWMRRYGMLERDPQKGMWRLTDSGQRIVTARMRAAQQRELEALPDEALVQAMQSVVSRYRFTDRVTATMLRREFLFGTQAR
jgi:restriction endonuclease Mrr